MSSVSSHDRVGELLKFLESTAGRDRFCRLLQYFSKYLKYREETQKRRNEATIEALQSLYSSMSMVRKVLRFFRSAAVLRALKETWGKREKIPTVELYFNLLAKCFLASYFFFDHFQYFKAIGFLKVSPETGKFLGQLTEGSWLMEIVCNLGESSVKLLSGSSTSVEQRNATMRAFIRNCFDFPLALHFLGLAPTTIPHGYFGLSGTISSSIGIWENWPTIMIQQKIL